jgi:hypothetical protein
VLSTDNPYASPNLFLSKRLDSPHIRGFIDYQGIPPALAVEDGWFSPLKVTLYYPSKQYLLIEMQDGWLIQGPKPLLPDEEPILRKLTDGVQTAPKILGINDPAAVSAQVPTSEPLRAEITPIPRLPQVSSASKAEKHKLPAPRGALRTGTLVHQNQSLAAAIAAADAPTAELTPQGDVVHYVTHGGETLSIIARWYTGDISNTGKLTRINQITDPGNLNIGDVVLIPAYLVKNKKCLSEESLKAIERLVAN